VERSEQGVAKRAIVFLGAGHAHLFALQRLSRFVAAGHAPVVVAPGPFWYSGLATAVLSGRHGPERDMIDVAALVRRAGGHFIQDTVTSIDPVRRTVHLAGAAPVAYDLLSLSLGSVVPDIAGAAAGSTSNDDVFAVKPIARLWDLRQRLCRDRGGAPPRVVLAGGGITAAEVAANLLGLGRQIQLVIVAGGPLLATQSKSIASQVAALLASRGATIRCDTSVAALDGNAAVLATGERLAFDVFVNATGLIPSPLIRSSGLPVDQAGGLMVDDTLRCIEDHAVFGGGDCIAFGGRSLPRAGVFGVRQAPVLFDNLLAASGVGTPRPYRPQRRYLWIMNLGDGTGLASWGALHWRGRLALQLKDAIDLRFLRAFQGAAST
jgi:NADH dehydrogenase FAD-containing subunit